MKPQKEELHPILATYPLELVHMDYLMIENPKSDKNVSVLVITDHCMCCAQAIITSSKTPKVTAQVLWNQYMVHYGLPTSFISDQGQSLESKHIRKLCHLAWVKKLRTTQYHLETNRQCERFNSTLINMIDPLEDKDKFH